MSTYFKLDALIWGIDTTATAAGTTTLTASSKPFQQFTGSTTQIVKLPDATTLQLGRRFDILNRSTGSVTVQDSTGAVLATLTTNSQQYFVVRDISTAAGLFSTGGASSGGGGATVSNSDKLNLLNGIAGISLQTDNIRSKFITMNSAEELGGDYWTSKVSLPTARSQGAALNTINGYTYVLAGESTVGVGNDLKKNTRYSDDSNTFLNKADMIDARSYGAYFVLSGLGYANGGGYGTAARSPNTESYNDSTNTWTSRAASADSKTESFICGTLNGYAYVLGGFTTVVINNIDQYNPTNNVWTYTGALLGTARYDGAWGRFSDRITTFGGSTGGAGTTGVQSYLPAINSVVTENSLPVTLVASGGTTINDQCYIVSGVQGGSAVTTVYKYSNDMKNYVIVSSLPYQSTYPFGGDLNGIAYSMGGASGGSSIATTASYRAFSYQRLGTFKNTDASPTSVLCSILAKEYLNNINVQVRSDGNSWRNLTPNADSATKFGETLSSKFLPTQLGYVHGGYSALSSLEYYNDSANTYLAKASSTLAAGEHGSFKIAGLGYSFGGDDGVSTYYQTAQRYNDFTNTWSALLTNVPVVGTMTGFTISDVGYAVVGYNGSSILGNVYAYNVAGNSWTGKATLNSIRNSGCGHNILDRGYLSHGSTTVSAAASTATIEEYIPATDSWVTKTSGNFARQSPGHSAFEGFGYVYGGENTGGSSVNSVEKYDPNSDSWTSLTGMNSNRGQRPGAFMFNSYIYAAGGFSGGALATTEQFNPSANSWANKASLNTARRFASSNFSPGNLRSYEVRIGLPALYEGPSSYIWTTLTAPLGEVAESLAGMNLDGNPVYRGYQVRGTGQSAKGWRYNPTADAWTSYIPLNSARAGADDFVLHGLGYTVGGSSGSSTVERLDISTNSSAVMTTLNTSTSACGSSALNGFGYAVGGHNGSYQSVNQRYNDSTNAWTNKTALGTARAFGKQTTASGFLVLGAGEIPASTATALYYNDASDAWTSITSMSVDRDNQPFAETVNGNAVFAAGTEAGTNGVTAEYYSFPLNAWIKIASMSTARAYPGQIALSNDSSIILGGTNLAGSASQSSVEKLSSSLRKVVAGLALEVK